MADPPGGSCDDRWAAVSITVLASLPPLCLSRSRFPFFRPILYFHFCQILLSRTAAPLRGCSTHSPMQAAVLSSLYRRLTHASCSHLCVGTPARTCSFFFSSVLPLPCTLPVRCCAVLSLVIALTRAAVWYPFRAHTLRSHSDAMLAPAHSFLSCVTQYRNTAHTREYTSVVIFT